MIDDDEDVIDPREQAEAAALARALDPTVVTSVPPVIGSPIDALEVAALVRTAHYDDAELTARVARVGATLRDERLRAESRARRRRGFGLAFGFAAAAAVVLFVGDRGNELDFATASRRAAAPSGVATDTHSIPVQPTDDSASLADELAQASSAAGAAGREDARRSSGDVRRAGVTGSEGSAEPMPAPTRRPDPGAPSNPATSTVSRPVVVAASADRAYVEQQQRAALRGEISLAELDDAMRPHRAAMFAERRNIESYDRWIGALERAMRLADRRGHGEARRVLEGALAIPLPAVDPGLVRAPLQDLYFRLAVLALEAHDPRLALDLAARGLDLWSTPDVHVTNLRLVEAAGHDAFRDPTDASRARAAAHAILDGTRGRD